MQKEKKIQLAQQYLRAMKADGWLLYDFHGNNNLAHAFLEIPSGAMTTRRFFYWIPAEGTPIRIVHAIESHVLDGWPGEKRLFLSWQSLQLAVQKTVQGAKKIAMEYSPKNGNPYVSRVDGGTIDLIRSFGIDVVSSGGFLPHFTAVLDAEQGASQARAAQKLNQIVHQTWSWIEECLKQERSVNEYEIQQKILDHFQQNNLITESPPIVAINAHSADPHFVPVSKGASELRKGDFLLIDLWARENKERTVYGDITKVAVASDRPTKRQDEVFQVVRRAQKAGIDLVKKRFSEKKQVTGAEIDDAVRKVVVDAGYGEYFTHRTGHSIDTQLHGSGVNLDNLEMEDLRPILPATCFSVEPGIYLPGEFGVRLESDVYVHADGRVEVTGGEQDELHALLSGKSFS